MAVPPPELTSSTVTIDNLPEEILSEVLLGIPTPAALVHAAAVSKRWRRVIAAPDGKFLEKYRARHKSSPLLGLYIQREFGGPPSFQKADSIQSAHGDESRDIDLERAAAKAFSLGGLESHPDWHLRDCYNGRLLLAKGEESLEVYNPLSCERILVCLPQDDLLPDYFSASLLQGHGDDASSFRVVSVQHIRRRRNQAIRAVEYDSRRKTWKDHPWDWEILKNIERNEPREVMHAGKLIFCKYTGPSLLMLDTGKMQFSVLPLPGDNNPTNYAIGEMEDGVCCLASVESVGKLNTLHLRVWRLELEELDWKLEKEMQVKQVLGEHACHGHSYYKVRKVANGIALLCWSKRSLHFIIDMKTLCVMDKFEFNNHLPAFPMQMPWPPTFSVAAVYNEQSPLSIGAHKSTTDNLAADSTNALGEEQSHFYTMMNHGSRSDGNQPELQLRDGAASQNCIPSRAPENLGIQDTVASVSTPAREECFKKEINVPNDCDLQALIPDLCDRVSDLMHPEVTRHHHSERGESLVRLEQRVQCPIAGCNDLHPKYCIKDSESPHTQEIKRNWGPIQVCIKGQRCLEDWDDSEGEDPGSCERDIAYLEGMTDFEDYMKFLKMYSSNQCGNGGSESNTLSMPGQGGVEHGQFNAGVQERFSVQLIGHSSLEPDGAICTGAQDPLTLQTNLDGQYVEEDPEIPCNNAAAILGRSDVYCSHDTGPELRDECAAHNCVPSNALEDLGSTSGCQTRDLLNGPMTTEGDAYVVREGENHVCAVINSGSTEGKNPGAAARGDEVEGTETGAESEVEAVETSSENEDMAEDSHTIGDAAEEFPPSRRRRQQKSGERGDSLLPLPDHLRCARNDGKKWRCSASALQTVRFCKYHYAKANKGKKLLVDGKKNKRKGMKSINPPASPEATTSDCHNSNLLNGPMTTKCDVVEDSPPPSPPCGHRRQQKLGERGHPLPDHLRCIRNDGKKWRCSASALPTVRFCEYHYAKANKGKKLLVDGKKNKRKGTKSINPPAPPEATTSDCQNRDPPNGPMTTECDAVEDIPPPFPPCGRRRKQKLGEHGHPLPDHLRCIRNDGKKWRCSASALPTVRFCEYHYAKANKGKKLPADGEILAVALQRLKNKRKARKTSTSPAPPQATTSACQTRDLLDGLMMTSPGSSGPATLSSPVKFLH